LCHFSSYFMSGQRISRFAPSHSSWVIMPEWNQVWLMMKHLLLALRGHFVYSVNMEDKYAAWCSLLGLSAVLCVRTVLTFRWPYGHQNVSTVRTPNTADSLRRLHQVHSPRKHQDLQICCCFIHMPIMHVQCFI
jgi:hypothetical protein